MEAFRPQLLLISAGFDGHRLDPLAGWLLEASYRGSYYLIRTGHAGGVTLTCELSPTAATLPAVGQPLTLRLDAGAITLLPLP